MERATHSASQKPEVNQILYLWGFPENPIGAISTLFEELKDLAPKGIRSLPLLELIISDPEFRPHPRAWQEFVRTYKIPKVLAQREFSPPQGWPVPVYLERVRAGGIVHVQFESHARKSEGERIDLSGPMEVLLGVCEEMGEGVFPDAHARPFVGRIRDGVGLQGRSWELPSLIGYFAFHSGKGVAPIFSTGSVRPDGAINPGERLLEKVEGWLREIGPGGIAIATETQLKDLEGFARGFQRIVTVSDVRELAAWMREQGWFTPHQKDPGALGYERLLKLSQEWYKKGKPRMALLTLKGLEARRKSLSPRQEVIWLGTSHYVLSCFGRFSEGMEYLRNMIQRLGEHPGVLSPEERVIFMAKAAVQLYDAHRFREAEDLLSPLLNEPNTMNAVSQAARAKLLGTLGQILTALDKWDEGFRLLEQAKEIFEATDPLEVSRSYHYMIHNRLRASDLKCAQKLLSESGAWLEDSDLYGGLFRTFYQTDLSLRKGLPCPRPKLPEAYDGLVHPYCFALQAWARNDSHALEERISAVGEAAARLEGAVTQGGVLEFLANTYRLYEAILAQDTWRIERAWKRWREWIVDKGGEPFQAHYKEFLSPNSPELGEVERLMAHIPYH